MRNISSEDIVSTVIGFAFLVLCYIFQEWVVAHQIWLPILIIYFVFNTNARISKFSYKADEITRAAGADFNRLIDDQREMRYMLAQVQNELRELRDTFKP